MEDMPVQFTSMLFLQFFLSFGYAGAFTTTNILTANTVYREILGTSNGLAQAVSSCARAAGPSLCGVLFSVGAWIYAYVCSMLAVYAYRSCVCTCASACAYRYNYAPYSTSF